MKQEYKPIIFPTEKNDFMLFIVIHITYFD
uniref:Uncharacterized protein n=1 Tax=Lepeophtheirus salmonis TaxID=72036 RepID=A0A0K2V8N0_LEPSM